jgi:hypothetical protein
LQHGLPAEAVSKVSPPASRAATGGAAPDPVLYRCQQNFGGHCPIFGTKICQVFTVSKRQCTHGRGVRPDFLIDNVLLVNEKSESGDQVNMMFCINDHLAAGWKVARNEYFFPGSTG